MLGGKGDRIAEAEAEGFIDAVAPEAFGLVGDDDDRLAGAAHGRGEMPVGGVKARPRVDDKQDRVAIGERRFGLRAHAPGERVGIAFLQTRRVDDGEGEVGELRFALAAIAGDAGLIVDQRQLASDEPVEQRRLADVRPADDRNLGAHVALSRSAGHARPRYFAADRLEATSPSQRLANCRSSGETSGSPSTRSSSLAASS